MGLQATVRLNPPALPDVGVWFANAAAFNNYMRSFEGEVDIEPANNTVYAPSDYNEALVPAGVNIDGVDYVLITLAMFQSLLDKVNTLDTSYKNLRTEMKNAGIIVEAQ